jgi:starch phosphorylase
VHAITNGVHAPTWAHPSLAKLYDRYVPDWRHEPELLARADSVPPLELWEGHTLAKRELIDVVSARTGVNLDPELPIVGFARRMTSYKRPGMLFSDLGRLRAIAKAYPFQVVLAGKAHPADGDGKALIKTIFAHIAELTDMVTVAYLPDYDMSLAQLMVAGADLWLNTPLRPLEASGTSGMKAAINGVPQLSVLDGWWVEGCIEGITGWSIGDSSSPTANGNDADALYDKLERHVLRRYHDDRAGWIEIMRGAVVKNAAYFNSHRMMRRYAAEAYLPHGT